MNPATLSTKQLQRRHYFIYASILIPILAYLFLQPIPQDQAYHLFADQRTLWGIPHFGDVMGNLAFMIAGLYGLKVVIRNPQCACHKTRLMFGIFFSGVFLTAFGSGWYHLQPDDERLVWDRLPMTVAFMGLFAGLISERLDEATGTRLLAPLLVLGAFSVFWWSRTDDLRLYAMVQFYPMLALLLILWLLPNRYSHGHYFWAVLGWYVVAKLMEHFDLQIQASLTIVSGHNLKHVIAALAPAWLAMMLAKRQAYTRTS